MEQMNKIEFYVDSGRKFTLISEKSSSEIDTLLLRSREADAYIMIDDVTRIAARNISYYFIHKD